MKSVLVAAVLLVAALSLGYIQNDTSYRSNETWLVQERNVRAHLEFLAGDAMKGRGSMTEYEHIAAQYIAAQLRQFGIEPAGDSAAKGQKSFLQTIALTKRAFAEAPRLVFNFAEKTTEWTHGREFVLSRVSAAEFSGPLQKMEIGGQPRQRAIVLLNFPEDIKSQERSRQMRAMLSKGAAAVLAALPSERQQRWSALASRMPELPMTSDSSSSSGSMIYLSMDAAQALQQIPNGTAIQIKGKLSSPEIMHTWNVVGQLRGSDPKLAQEAVLLSAHLDHLGVRRPVAGDSIYNGADDDASGVVAVLELARVLGMGPKPKRTIYFALFGSEERGGYGSQHFIKNSPVPLNDIVADLQFEMIGRPDPKVPANTLWLTGYERSNLGPELAKQGARLVADPHSEENFFQRSDNFAFARLGVIAHTVSSYGLHQEYHQPDDDLAHIDFVHITNAINAMIKPVQWLANSNFRPTWNEGLKP
ncbi:M20/M25/M40 family metallo-hydrolase [candidate division KSB1 bacterium]|nr:M20/M25/M40 family metallo-hydrolase [candidate division KSB1 bacterium]